MNTKETYDIVTYSKQLSEMKGRNKRKGCA